MVNQVYVDKLVSLIKQGVIVINDIKIQEYKDAVQAALNA